MSLTNAEGQQLSAEFLLVQPDFERLVLPYKKALEKLGIKTTVRIVDTALYVRRTTPSTSTSSSPASPQSFSPGNEQREFWGSEAADKEGSRNLIGIKNPAIDTLIDKIILAKDRADLVAATRALDRVLLWNHYVVPQFHSPFERLAFWDKFAGRPAAVATAALPAHVVVRRHVPRAALRRTRRHSTAVNDREVP